MTPTGFVFVVAQPGSSGWLKQELRLQHPELSLAYSEPGLYTFKNRLRIPVEDYRLRAVFARHWGYSLGWARDPEGVVALAAPLRSAAVLHVYPRCPSVQEDPASAVIDQRVSLLREQLLRLSPARFLGPERPEPGALVLDVMVPPAEGEHGAAPSTGRSSPGREAIFLGFHRHDRTRTGIPGGVRPVVLPAGGAPSRSYRKLEEALAWSGIELVRGQQVLEIGCAPGGATLALLARGLHVVGVDPGEMDPRVGGWATEHGATFRHLQRPIGAVTREDVPRRVQWLVCDANLAPQVALRYVCRWVRALRPRLQGVILTVKLNDERVVAAIPRLLARLAELGFGQPQAVQLPSHRRELVAILRRPQVPE